MMYNFPFFPHFYSRPYYSYPQNNFYNNHSKQRKNDSGKISSDNHIKEKKENKGTDKFVENNDTIFEIFGIKLHSDDILLICLIFFLYNEGVKDEFLFMALVLLLLS